MQNSTNQGKPLKVLTFHELIRRFSVMRPNRRVRDAQSPGESASRRVQSTKLASSRFTSRTATQVGRRSDQEDRGPAWLCSVHISICYHELSRTVYATIYRH